VTALKEGECKIYVETEDGSFQDFVTVKVDVIPVDRVTQISASANTVEQGKSLQLTATVTPSIATSKTVIWSLDVDSSIATITSGGLLQAKDKDNVIRTVKVTATPADGKGGTPLTETITIIVT